MNSFSALISPQARRLARVRRVMLLTGVLVFGTKAWAFDTPELMGWLAQTKEASATFVESRHVNGFDAPMTLSGELRFKAPDLFERRTLKPAQESMVVDGTALTLARGSQRRTMHLDAAPEAAAIVGAIRGTLTGDVKALERHFKLGLSGRPEQWLLDLMPRDAQLAASVRTVQIRGQRGQVRVIEVWFASGDRSVMNITPKP
jgi:outer membrane lipoprotein-sorting protein